MGFADGERVFSYFPLFFSGGLCNALTSTLSVGGELVTQRRFDPAGAAGLIRRRACTARDVWHDGLESIAAAPGFAAADLARMRRGLLVDAATLERFGLPLDDGVNMYGSTETATAFTCHRFDDDPAIRMRTHGTPLDGNELRIVDPGTGRPLADGEEGEIAIRGPRLMRGYTDGSHLALTDEDGWFRTGDIGVREAGGQLRYTGRLKTLIKVKGLTIQPEEVEAVLMTHPDVEHAVVAGVGGTADESTELRALVALRDAAALAGVEAHCRRELSSYKVPRLVPVPLERFPLAANRKVDRTAATRMLRP
jgi:fatty-acyl-CoA synthase